MKPPLESGDMIRMAPHLRLRWEQAQSCYVLLYPEGIVQLNETAAEIMKRCEGEGSVESVMKAIQALYPGEPVEADVRAFLEEAVDHGWLTVEQS